MQNRIRITVLAVLASGIGATPLLAHELSQIKQIGDAMKPPVSSTSPLADGATDLAVWRPSTGTWRVIKSSDGSQSTRQWGAKGDVPVSGDFDGDKRTDMVVWRPSSGTWFITKSTDGSQPANQWGADGDIPVAGDYDGDERTDLTVWRPSTGIWWIIMSSDGSQGTKQWGVEGDVPVPGDYDGDGRDDFAVWRPSTGTWWLSKSSDGSHSTTQWGAAGDVPVSGDFDGDKRTDMVVWRPSSGTWYITKSSDGSQTAKQWGAKGDVPVTGDYDSDGRADFAVWRPSTGTWWIIKSSDGSQTTKLWGVAGDIPVPGDYDVAPGLAAAAQFNLSPSTPQPLPVAAPGGTAVLVYRDIPRVEIKWIAPSGTSNLKLLRADVATSPAFVEVLGAKYGVDWAIDQSVAMPRLYMYRLIGFLPSGVPVGSSPISVNVPPPLPGVNGLNVMLNGVLVSGTGLYAIPKEPLAGPYGYLGSFDTAVGHAGSSANAVYTKVLLQWGAVAEATGYEIHRKQLGASDAKWLPRSHVKLPLFAEVVAPGTYTYMVRASYANGTITSRPQTITVGVGIPVGVVAP